MLASGSAFTVRAGDELCDAFVNPAREAAAVEADRVDKRDCVRGDMDAELLVLGLTLLGLLARRLCVQLTGSYFASAAAAGSR